MTYILSELEAKCPPADATERVLDAFPPQTGSCSYQLSAPLHEIGLPGEGDLVQRVSMTVGKPDLRSYATVIPLSWQVDGNPIFPHFNGSIEITPLASDRVQIAILGHYRPPLYPVGAVFDAALGHRLAQATIDGFLRTLRECAELPEASGVTSGARK